MVGQRFSHYEILEKLGEGGMGVVYKARDTMLDRVVALKFLPAGLVSTDTSIARFIQEAKAAAALNHPNICTIHSIEQTGDTHFIVMEFVDGKTLRTVAQSSAPSQELVLGYALQIADALAEAHARGVVHRDVKSENIMLNTKNQIKVMDFGLAKLRDSVHMTKSSSTVGTLAYMAPERLHGVDVDHRSDIFSFGVVTYELLTGQLPFKGMHEAALMYEIVNTQPKSVRAVQPGVHPALESLIMKCLTKDPAKRYQTAEELVRDLRSVQLSSSPAPQTTKLTLRSKRTGVLAAVLAVLGVVALLIVNPFSRREQSRDAVKTLAVLPFVDLSPQGDQEYFSDGLSEELLNVLAHNSSLRVTSRTSSFSFKGKEADVRTIASKLDVKHILEGSVRKSGNHLRITAQLIDVETDAHLWSETYEGTVDNIFALQDTISQSVVEALKVVLLNNEAASPKKETHPDAYNAYLLGRHFLSRLKNPGKAEQYFQKALAIDACYAPAWIELSRIHSSGANDGSIPIDDGYRNARREVEKALACDPNSADAHAQLGFIKRRYDWDWRGADESYQRALKLDPQDAGALSGAAGLARTLGRIDEAVSLMRQAVEHDPVSSGWHFNLGLYALNAGLLDESYREFIKCLELSPQYGGVYSAMSILLLERGNLDSALASAMKETEPDWKLYALALVYHARGDKKKSEGALTELIRNHQNDDAYQIAEVYAYRGEVNKAFEWLDRAYEQRDGGLPSTIGNPLFRNITKDPRYAALLKKLRLPV